MFIAVLLSCGLKFGLFLAKGWEAVLHCIVRSVFTEGHRIYKTDENVLNPDMENVQTGPHTRGSGNNELIPSEAETCWVFFLCLLYTFPGKSEHSLRIRETITFLRPPLQFQSICYHRSFEPGQKLHIIRSHSHPMFGKMQHAERVQKCFSRRSQREMAWHGMKALFLFKYSKPQKTNINWDVMLLSLCRNQYA